MKKAVDDVVLNYVTHSLCLYYKYVAVFILTCILIQYCYILCLFALIITPCHQVYTYVMCFISVC